MERFEALEARMYSEAKEFQDIMFDRANMMISANEGIGDTIAAWWAKFKAWLAKAWETIKSWFGASEKKEADGIADATVADAKATAEAAKAAGDTATAAEAEKIAQEATAAKEKGEIGVMASIWGKAKDLGAKITNVAKDTAAYLHKAYNWLTKSDLSDAIRSTNGINELKAQAGGLGRFITISMTLRHKEFDTMTRIAGKIAGGMTMNKVAAEIVTAARDYEALKKSFAELGMLKVGFTEEPAGMLKLGKLETTRKVDENKVPPKATVSDLKTMMGIFESNDKGLTALMAKYDATEKIIQNIKDDDMQKINVAVTAYMSQPNANPVVKRYAAFLKSPGSVIAGDTNMLTKLVTMNSLVCKIAKDYPTEANDAAGIKAAKAPAKTPAA